jgi:hypothetical protein
LILVAAGCNIILGGAAADAAADDDEDDAAAGLIGTVLAYCKPAGADDEAA